MVSFNAIFRDATKYDYEGVLDINRDVYNGSDYIPDRYMQYLNLLCFSPAQDRSWTGSCYFLDQL